MRTKAKYRQHRFAGSVSFAASAEVIDCPSYVSAQLCAESPLEAQAIQTLIGQDRSLRQTRAWKKDTDFLIGIFTSAAGRAYHVALYAQPEGGTFIRWIFL
ncbi:hypothetical protein [Deinococcus frigens]|uniref:hypothetical protein n=1 Tax=Deinococcus frigens TaxID=249403 RepID=UPI000496699D|nr:hypothetical protein [Deinococcus frigens]